MNRRAPPDEGGASPGGGRARTACPPPPVRLGRPVGGGVFFVRLNADGVTRSAQLAEIY